MLALLAAAAVLADDFERAARQAVYGDGVRVAVQTDVQEVVLTGGGPAARCDLYLDGRLRVSAPRRVPLPRGAGAPGDGRARTRGC